ncbi:MAG: type II-A CRISPR-associated protein Csn2 [Lachnospiraceae bacterium]|nr:type II-A CRISPR-associated protein Csn2 [Lachnospiraceae bacterium]
MTLTNTAYDFTIDLKENTVYVLDIGNKIAYREIISDIWNQVNGKYGRFILSDGEKEKNIYTEMDCILNLFELDCNNKRILNKVYQEIKQVTNENMLEDVSEINTYLINFLEKSLGMVHYSLEYDYDLDISNIFKMFNVRFDTEEESLQAKLINYIRIMHQVCRINIFLFANLKQFFSSDELMQIYEALFYEKVILITVESAYINALCVEKHMIIDEDLCIIEL